MLLFTLALKINQLLFFRMLAISCFLIEYSDSSQKFLPLILARNFEISDPLPGSTLFLTVPLPFRPWLGDVLAVQSSRWRAGSRRCCMEWKTGSWVQITVIMCGNMPMTNDGWVVPVVRLLGAAGARGGAGEGGLGDSQIQPKKEVHRHESTWYNEEK